VKRVSSVLVIIVACGLVSSCRSSGEPRAGANGSRARALNVRVAPVVVRDVVYEVKTLGSLEAEEVVQVTAEVNGAVSEVLFNAGDRVTPETVIVRIDPERYRLEAERAAAAHRRAVADWQRAEAEMKRREALGREQLVSDEELHGARQETERLAADAAAAKAAEDIARQNLKRSDVRPSRAGVINTRSVDTGQFVQTGTVLATLIDIGRLRLRIKVSDAESLRVKDGQDVSFRVASIGDREFTARIYHVGETADPSTRQVEVLGWVRNPGVLKPGFFAEVSLATEAHKNAIVVPESAVQASERGFVTYVIEGGKARQRPVQIGMRTGDGLVEILSGLKPGETVVSEGSDRLADGIAVQALGTEAAPGGAEGRP